MTGGELQALVTGLADELGLWWSHFPDSRRQLGSPGWVDLVILGWHGGRFAEIKGTGDRRTRDQMQVGQRLDVAFCELPYRLWYPRDWYTGLIRKDLELIR